MKDQVDKELKSIHFVIQNKAKVHLTF